MDLSKRLPGPDVVRAVAMFGVVVMNYHGYLIIRGAQRGDGALDRFFDPWTGPLSTRFAATFVLTAGIGVTLMTRSSIGHPERVTAMRWLLVRRGLVLYAGGLLFDYIWSGTILPFYGAMFVLAAVMFTWRSRWILLVGIVAAIAGWSIRWWVYERSVDDISTAWLTDPSSRSPRGLVFDLFVNGTHPLLPWLAFFVAGIVLARLFPLAVWRPATIGVGIALYSTATIVASLAVTDRSRVLVSDNPFDRGIVYTASALGTSLIAYASISWVADRFVTSPVIDVLRRAGQLSLTIYVAHALVFNLVVDWLGLIEPAGLGTALVVATTFWVVAVALASDYQRRHGRGPVEQLYRRLTA